MREFARFLLEIKKICPRVMGMADCVAPDMFPLVVQAVRITAGFDEEKHAYKTPSLALKLGYSLANVAAITRSEGLINRDAARVEDWKDFLVLYESDWKDLVSSATLQTLECSKANKPRVLPLFITFPFIEY